MATYKVTLVSEEHSIDTTIDCADDVFVLDAKIYRNQTTCHVIN